MSETSVAIEQEVELVDQKAVVSGQSEVQPQSLTVIVLVNSSRDWGAAVDGLQDKQTSVVSHAKPRTWNKLAEPSHQFATFAGLRLADVKLLRERTKTGLVANWLEIKTTVEETLRKVALEVHPLA